MSLEIYCRRLAAKIPIWKNGLRERQVQPIVHILDGQDVILCTAAGDGNSAIFTVSIIRHLAVSEAPTDVLPSHSRVAAYAPGLEVFFKMFSAVQATQYFVGSRGDHDHKL
jgi:hypothetical protein